MDGQGYADEGRYHVYEGVPYERQARQRDVVADAEGGWAHSTAEIAAMYDPGLGLRRLDRTLVCTPSGRLVLLDLAEAEEARTWTFLLQTDPADGAGARQQPADQVGGGHRARTPVRAP
ncbi:hypothetical protein ACFYNN_36060 [Streptomyces sp. NPDC006978]|uniref:hypothetical protein n=1 Tax=unclassified Streptomyces TaxID=2593676 RepID=UPI002AFF517F|nr:hypothetical protein [Streptomyces sp. S584]